MAKVWRINIKPASKEGIDPRQFCLTRGILGIGWPVKGDKNIDWETYYNLGRTEYPDNNSWWPAINAVRNRMSINDMCWTRDWSGAYYLGRIISDWEYKGDDEYLAADVVNIRKCDWKKIGTADAVPGKVINSFIPSRTVQEVHDRTIVEFSQFLYNSLSEEFKYPSSKVDTDIFSLLSAEDCEDIIGLYLQDLGYRIIPSSCKDDTLAYEFVMKHNRTFETAVAQVKNGAVDLNFDDFASVPAKVFLFTSKGSYTGTLREHVQCIHVDTVKEYINNNISLLPSRIQTWLKLLKNFT